MNAGSIGAVVLAAGMSKRMKRQKLLLPFQDGTIVLAVLTHVLQAGFDQVVAVVSREIYDHVSEDSPDVEIVLNDNPELGQSESLRLGMKALKTRDFCVMLGDLPLVMPSCFMEYRERFYKRSVSRTALAPFRQGRYGHPSFFSYIWRERFLPTAGDVGGRNAMALHSEEIDKIPGEDASFTDVDTPEDYDELLHNIGS